MCGVLFHLDIWGGLYTGCSRFTSGGGGVDFNCNLKSENLGVYFGVFYGAIVKEVGGLASGVNAILNKVPNPVLSKPWICSCDIF